MKKFYSYLKTSDKITFLFTFSNFISLIILLFGINIIYFFAWYSDQREDSMYDMNKNYTIFASKKTETNLESFKEYILQKDTLIIPEDGSELICSNGVEMKIHNQIEDISNKLFYNTGEKTFFIFSKYYEGIGEVKVFFDTTPYVKSQILIIKISLIIIFVSIFIYFLIGKKISRVALSNLKGISEKLKGLDIDKNFEKLPISGNIDDEINLLAKAVNKSYKHIQDQTFNLKQFISDVSHEFKTPLMVIASHIDLYTKKIEKNKLNKEDTTLLIKNIKFKLNHLNKLLETFLHLSRVENNIEKLSTKKLVFNDYLKDITQKYLSNINTSVEVKYIFTAENEIYINKDTFNLLFENLLSNAIKFSSPNSKIEIGSNDNSFWVKDNGIGIEKDKLKNIWNKFYRNDVNKEGFGIGLFLVKRLVYIYGWKIEVESKLGEGTKFIIKY